MKGLLIKDFYMIKNGCLPFLFVIGIFTVLSFIPNDRTYMFFTLYSIVFSSMLTIGLIGYDEKSKWETYLDTLPFSRKTAVTEKYLLTYIITSAVWLLTNIAKIINLCFFAATGWNEFLTFALVSLVVGIIFPSVILPAVFKFGTNKGRLFSIITVIIAFASAYILYSELANIKIILVILAITAILALPVSWLLSVRFYKKREF